VSPRFYKNSKYAHCVRAHRTGSNIAIKKSVLRRWSVKLVLAFITFAVLIFPALAQRADVSVVGGGGVVVAEEGAGTASRPWSTISSPHRAPSGPARCLFQRPPNGSENHFITGSYVLQGGDGRTRRSSVRGGCCSADLSRASAPGLSRRVEPAADSSFAVVLGGGATVDIGHSLFIRPQFRVYGHVGPTLTFLPSVGFGWRF
jgi:hypothetical protein